MRRAACGVRARHSARSTGVSAATAVLAVGVLGLLIWCAWRRERHARAPQLDLSRGAAGGKGVAAVEIAATPVSVTTAQVPVDMSGMRHADGTTASGDKV